MNKVLYDKILEAFSSVLPITVIVIISSVVLVPLPSGMLLMFLVGSALLILGMGFFTMGADMSMMPIGEGIGVQLTGAAKTTSKSKNSFFRFLIQSGSLLLIIAISFIMGVIITIAEPDLQVLASQVPIGAAFHWLPESLGLLVLAVAAGVGVFLVISVLRTIFKIPLKILLIIFYALTFAMVFVTPDNFIPVAFDSGGVTTGPITVPFILAMGVGVASIRADKGSVEDSFGLVALCSVGPIITVLIIGLIFHPPSEPSPIAAIDAATSRDVARQFGIEFPRYFREVLQAMAAIIAFFLIFQLISRRYRKTQVKRIGMGLLYTFIGLVVFLTGVNVGFIPVGQFIGKTLAASPKSWVLIPFGMIVGYFIVQAEPAVHVLNKQVETISSGAISQKTMSVGLAIGMASAIGLTMLRVLAGIDLLYFIVPGYILAIVMTFIVPPIFVGIAFDSGGVCSGPMTSTFLLPLSIGVCMGAGRDLMRNAFGVVALVALAPLIVIQLIGLIYLIKTRGKGVAEALISEEEAGQIIIYDEVFGKAA